MPSKSGRQLYSGDVHYTWNVPAVVRRLVGVVLLYMEYISATTNCVETVTSSWCNMSYEGKDYRESLLLSLLGGQRSMIGEEYAWYTCIYIIYIKGVQKVVILIGSNLSAHLCEYMTRCAPCI